MSDPQFNGFRKETVKFYRGLKRNNSKSWFNDHREEYDNLVLTPARAFVMDMGVRLRRIAPEVNADPRIDRSIFRIFRDIRFSKDKSPFKTHLGIWFWDGDGRKMECSGFYFHLSPPHLMLAVGMYIFPKPMLDSYRQAVIDPPKGAALRRAIRKVSKVPGCEVGGTHYKRVPRGFDPEHMNADLLRYNTLHAGIETAIPEEFYSADLLDYAFDRFKAMAPLHRWIRSMAERQPSRPISRRRERAAE